MAEASAVAEPQAAHARSIGDLGREMSMPHIVKRRFKSSQAAIVGLPVLRTHTQAVLDEDQKTRDEAAQKLLARTFTDALTESKVPPKLIAERCGVSEQAVSNWKRTGKIRSHFLPVISELTGWSIYRLLTGAVESRPAAPAPVARPNDHSVQVPYGQEELTPGHVREILADLEALLPEQRRVWRAKLHEQAEQARLYFKHYQLITGTTKAANARITDHISAAPRLTPPARDGIQSEMYDKDPIEDGPADDK